ncbi:hypothetical protein GCM10023185_26680 [Hymenobacter saemangeumensis]|uniref:CcmD family protein n=1 Tax=Hymenobacter saemangeumensis TaxID=1084522 RepID=A0ABP8IIX4_9BACT
MKIKAFPRLTTIFFLLLALLASASAAFAQGADTPAMADGLRASGKIYVVVAVVVVIVGGLLLYLIALDRKVSRLEKVLKP